MPNYFYHQGSSKNEPWKPVPASVRDKTLADTCAVFCTVLAVSKLVENLEPSEKDKLAYSGPFYLDWDSLDIAKAIEKVNTVLDKFEAMNIDLDSIHLYATGQKGFHAEIPMSMFVDGKLPKNGTVGLPLIYKEMVYELAVDTLDLKIYSSGKGRMWRLPNVKRPDNGKYKVQVTAKELRALAPTDEERALPREELQALMQERYDNIVSAPRSFLAVKSAEFNIDLHLMFAQAKQNIEERLKTRGSRKRDPLEKAKAQMPSIKLMMQGQGLRPDAGFHAIAMQVSICAVTAGITPEKMIEECSGLIENHQSDGDRYNSPAKRTEELLRLYDYMLDNPGYDFGVGAIKSLLIHEAPDLDNLPVNETEIKEVIQKAVETAADDANLVPDEYGDVAGGVTMSTYGVYIDTEHGKKRICSLSFRNIHLLYSMETGVLSGYEAEILINGRGAGRQTMEIDTFASLTVFNRFCYRHGHAMQGLEPHVRGLMMRFVEEGKKKGKVLYITKREGLDMVNIPNHPDEDLREPFMVYAAGSGVIMDPRVASKGVEVSFQGFPDPRGIFRTDLADAPALEEWLEDPENKMSLRVTLMSMMSMQKPDVMVKYIGWYTSCFYRMIFHKAYGKFPLLHVNGPAGSGKTEMSKTMASLFFYHQEPKVISPGSTFFAAQQHIAASASIPLLLDEYKPQDMPMGYHDKIRLAFRDAYNCRDTVKGGGTRESDDYRTLHHTQLSAPIVFIAEAAEEESAVAERVVLCTIVKPPSSQSLRQLAHYNVLDRNKHQLAILGQYLATEAINESGIDKLREEFDPIFKQARDKFMLTDADLLRDMSAEELAGKQGAKERSVFNYTVVRFGIRKFRSLVEAIFGQDAELLDLLTTLEDAVYGRMGDLQSATQPEWAKVMVQIASMTWNIDPEAPLAMKYGKDYALGTIGGKDVLEVNLRSAYLKYRSYAAGHRSKILFAGDQQFLHAMKDSPALLSHGPGKVLEMPQVYSFDVTKLTESGVMAFKPPVSSGAKKV